jgi:predicted nucleic acid-binding protein
MIAVDTNVLVYSHRSDSPFYQAAETALTGLAEAGDLWAIPWPCIHEFLAQGAVGAFGAFKLR